LKDCWPSTIGPIELGYDNKDLAQFEVTWTYNWHEETVRRINKELEG
jgi:hypothetical protein